MMFYFIQKAKIQGTKQVLLKAQYIFPDVLTRFDHLKKNRLCASMKLKNSGR